MPPIHTTNRVLDGFEIVPHVRLTDRLNVLFLVLQIHPAGKELDELCYQVCCTFGFPLVDLLPRTCNNCIYLLGVRWQRTNCTTIPGLGISICKPQRRQCCSVNLLGYMLDSTQWVVCFGSTPLHCIGFSPPSQLCCNLFTPFGHFTKLAGVGRLIQPHFSDFLESLDNTTTVNRVVDII